MCERITHQLPPVCPLIGDGTPKLAYVPDQESKPRPFRAQEDTPATLATPARVGPQVFAECCLSLAHKLPDVKEIVTVACTIH